MCLSIPAKVLTVDGDIAEVSAGGSLFKASLSMVEDVTPGDYILLHAGFAIHKLSESEIIMIYICLVCNGCYS